MTEEYLLSYTAAPMLPIIMQRLAQLHSEYNDWNLVEKHALEENVFQKPTVSSQKRVFTELLKRLKNFTSEEIKYLSDAPMDDVRHLSLLACLKTYRLIREFIAEVMHDKYYLFDYAVLNSDYVSFLESKEAHSKKIASSSESTRKKLRQVMFNMLQEGGLIADVKSMMIQKPLISDNVIRLIVADDPKLLGLYLMNKEEIRHHVERCS